MPHRKTLIASGIFALSVILNKTITMLNDTVKCIVYSGKSTLELCFETPKQRVKAAKCFILYRFLRWFHHTDGKHCAFCLTCGDKALGRRANDLTKIAGNFAIISSHYYVLI